MLLRGTLVAETQRQIWPSIASDLVHHTGEYLETPNCSGGYVDLSQ